VGLGRVVGALQHDWRPRGNVFDFEVVYAVACLGIATSRIGAVIVRPRHGDLGRPGLEVA